MTRVVSPGGIVAAYAWDLPGGGFPGEVMRAEMRAAGLRFLDEKRCSRNRKIYVAPTKGSCSKVRATAYRSPAVATQNNFGIALRVLGERGDDQALRRAVAKAPFKKRGVLEERTRERVIGDDQHQPRGERGSPRSMAPPPGRGHNVIDCRDVLGGLCRRRRCDDGHVPNT